MKAAQPQIESPFCALCNTPLDPDTPPGRKVCDGCMSVKRDVVLIQGQPPVAKMWKCKHICGRTLQRTSDNFYRDKKMADGFQSWCKQCDLEKKHERKRRAKANAGQGVKVQQHSGPNQAGFYLDLSAYPDLLAYLTDLSRYQERSLEGQIRWILRQCHKYQSTPWSKTETPSAECREGKP